MAVIKKNQATPRIASIFMEYVFEFSSDYLLMAFA
jgi:hypothetical protein